MVGLHNLQMVLLNMKPWKLARSGTDLISLLIFGAVVHLLVLLVVGSNSSESLRSRRFKSDRRTGVNLAPLFFK